MSRPSAVVTPDLRQTIPASAKGSYAVLPRRGIEPSAAYGTNGGRYQRRRDRRRFTIAALIGLGIAAIPYVWVLWDHRLDPLRTALPAGTFSNFYDIQARALFHGHWDVPRGSLGIEAFVVDGKEYTYFGPFSSLLRMPILAVTNRFDGQLTASSMLLAWVVTALFSSLLLWRVRLLVRGHKVLGRMEATSYAVLLATIMSGSVLLFLAGMPWVYHEDFAWGAALGIGALFALLGVLEKPSAWRVVATATLSLAAILSRTTIGWGCVIAVFLAALWFALGRGGKDGRRWWLPLLVAGLVPFTIGCVINWVKFGVPFGPPMGSQVFTMVNAHRRQVLAANGGKLWTPSFVPSTAWAYLRPDGLRLTALFPFITLPAAPASPVRGAVFDQTYRTGSMTASMPLLFLLGILGVVTAFRRSPVARAGLVRIPLLAAAVATTGVLVWGYIAHRYLTEFIPLLVVASAVGLVEVWRRTAGRSRRVRSGVLITVTALGLFGVTANVLIASAPTDRIAWEGHRVRSYVELQKSISDLTGHPLDRNIGRGEELPAWAPADKLFVVGRCAGLYISTGEYDDPWIPVDVRATELSISFHGPLPDMGVVPLLGFGKDPSSIVSVEGGGGHSVRFRVDRPGAFPTIAAWRPVQLGRTYTYRVTVTAAAGELHPLLVTLNGQEVLNGSTSSSGLPRAQPQHPQPDDSEMPMTVQKLRTSKPTLCRSLIGSSAK